MNDHPVNGAAAKRSARVKEWAEENGFSACGIADAGFPIASRARIPFYPEEIAELGYLHRNREILDNPLLMMPHARSIIALLYNYYPEKIIPEKDHFIIAKYAYGKDYHKVVKKRIEILAGRMKEEFGEMESMIFMDSGKIREKAWAQQSGIGWQGKNTLVIHPKMGSFFFIGIILTDLELSADIPATDHCGDCTRCIEACPTGALDNPYTLDPLRCISFLTIESEKPIPDELKQKFHDRIYGCDICQDTCPFNRKAQPTHDPDFTPSEKLFSMNKKDWLELTEEQFNQLFRYSAIKRIGFSKISGVIGQCERK